MVNEIIFIILGYLSGSVLYAKVFGILMKQRDITQESKDKNPGPANAFMQGGFWCGTCTLLFDLLKGFIPVFLYLRSRTWSQQFDFLFPLILAAPVWGHIFPVFFQFRGGKGIATTFGCLLGLVPYMKPALILAFFFLFFSLILRVTPHYDRTIWTYFATFFVMRWLEMHLFVARGFLLMVVGVLIRLSHSTEERKKKGEIIMDALILSCSTGGGHNAAGKAIGEELQKRGHHVEIWDPYELVSSSLANRIGNVYIKIAQRVPWLFGVMYFLGEGYRKLPFHSPVYFVNRRIAKLLKAYLEEHPADVIIMPHLFPAEVITYMKEHGMKVPKTMFIATDYACIPFTEETNCDYYTIPSKELLGEFVKKGIPESKLLPVGIPVSTRFIEKISREEAKRRLGLSQQSHYILVSGGSMGAGRLEQAIGSICGYMKKRKDMECIVICGNNKRLYQKLAEKEKKIWGLHVLESTKNMHLYLKASDVFLSKPGGLSSTEAAAAGSFLIHFSPIPGCELANRRFFQRRHMCIAVKNIQKQLIPAIQCAERHQMTAKMCQAQKKYVNGHACQEICDWLEENIVMQ